MYKASAKDVKMLQKWGENDEEIKQMIAKGFQPVGHVSAYWMPSQANWSWQIGVYTVDGVLYELLTRFGSVEGGRVLYQTENHFNTKEL